MSRLNERGDNARVLYQKAYRWIRMFESHPGMQDAPDFILFDQHDVSSFLCSLVSFRNRNVKTDCWLNPLRERQFWTTAVDKYPNLYIPF